MGVVSLMVLMGVTDGRGVAFICPPRLFSMNFFDQEHADCPLSWNKKVPLREVS